MQHFVEHGKGFSFYRICGKKKLEEESSDIATILKGQSGSSAENNLGAEWKKQERIDEDKSKVC